MAWHGDRRFTRQKVMESFYLSKGPQTRPRRAQEPPIDRLRLRSRRGKGGGGSWVDISTAQHSFIHAMLGPIRTRVPIHESHTTALGAPYRRPVRCRGPIRLLVQRRKRPTWIDEATPFAPVLFIVETRPGTTSRAQKRLSLANFRQIQMTPFPWPTLALPPRWNDRRELIHVFHPELGVRCVRELGLPVSLLTSRLQLAPPGLRRPSRRGPTSPWQDYATTTR